MPTALLFFAAALALSAEPSPAKVLIIGLDGVSFNLLEPFVADGTTPNLGRLMERGAHGELASLWPLRTPQVWTSIATGKYPGQHRIWDHISDSAYNPPPFRTAQRRLLTTKDRHSKALWNLLDEAGRPTLTSGWIASWPAEHLRHGIVAAPPVLQDPKRQVSIKGTFWRDGRQQVWPAGLWRKVKPLIVETGDIGAEDLRPFADLPADDDPIYELPLLRRYVQALKWSLARARSVEAITLALGRERRADLVMTYFQCSDSLLHRFWIFQQPVAEIEARLAQHGIPTTHAAELKKHFGNVVAACYRDLDERVGRLTQALADPQTLVMVVSDHGFGPAPEPHPDPNEPYGGNHRDKGILIATGAGVAPGSHIESASVLDIVPTVLYASGLAVADDMGGEVLAALFPAGELERRPPARIPTYEAKPQLDVPFAEGYPARRDRPLATDR